MSRTVSVPITPSVLSWAMNESGYTRESLAKDLKVSTETVKGWLEEGKQPKLTEFRKVVSLLKRAPATFLLPNPPEPSGFSIQFRRPSETARSSLTKTERHAIRDARRVQEAISWITKEMEEHPPEIPQYSVSDDVETVASSIRRGN